MSIQGLNSKYAMLLSHSCGIDNSEVLLISPVYLESDLKDHEVGVLRGSKAKDPKTVVQNWLRNENPSFIGLPSSTNFGDNGLVAALKFATMASKADITSAPVARVTYRALSYIQFRMAMFFLRDVQDSDETRDF